VSAAVLFSPGLGPVQSGEGEEKARVLGTACAPSSPGWDTPLPVTPSSRDVGEQGEAEAPARDFVGKGVDRDVPGPEVEGFVL